MSNNHPNLTEDELPRSATTADGTIVTTGNAAVAAATEVIAHGAPKAFKFHRRYLTVDKITEAHARTILGPRNNGNYEKSVAALISKMTTMKTDIRRWAKCRVRQIMVNNAVAAGIPVKVKNFADIRNWWKSLTSVTQKEIDIIGFVEFGGFTDIKGLRWDAYLESEYMQMKNWVYEDNKATASNDDGLRETEQKGFVASLIVNVKGDSVKQLQQGGMATHGYSVGVTRTEEECKQKKIVHREKLQYMALHKVSDDDCYIYVLLCNHTQPSSIRTFSAAVPILE